MRTGLGLLVLLASAAPAVAGLSNDSLYYKVFQSPYLYRSDKSGRGLTAGRSFTWLDAQTGPCLDPAGNYIYEVHESTLRRHNALSGAYTDHTLVHPARALGCGTDGEYFYYGWTAWKFVKATLDGVEVSVTELGQYYAPYHGIGVGRDTFWIVSSDFAPLDYRGYPCSEFTGDTAQYYSTINNPLGGVGIGMPICWDGERYFAACAGYPQSVICQWDAGHSLIDTVTIPVDVRTVMTPLLPTAVAERHSSLAIRPSPLASVVRGVLSISRQLTADGLRQEAALLDASGRRVMVLRSGENDVSRLAPGVYFVRPASGVEREASSVVRFVLAR
ncbi:MAG: hypothetical protein R6X13_03730 [bacterium]